MKLRNTLLLVPALMICGFAVNTQASELIFRTIKAEVHWANLSDYLLYLGPPGSTNPDYAVGYTMYDYFGDAERADGTFINPVYEAKSIAADISNNILGLVVYETDPAIPISYNSGCCYYSLFRSAHLPLENAFFSFNINILGKNLPFNTKFTQVLASSSQFYIYALSPTSSLTTAIVFDQPDPAFTLSIPTLERHINANASNWYNNPGTFEVIDGASVNHQLTLRRIDVVFTFKNTVIDALNVLDLTDPAISDLITETRLELNFQDTQAQGTNGDGGGVRIQYTMEMVASPGDDIDQDGIEDLADNCPTVSNVDQLNTDGLNGGGDVCDTDDDNDGSFDVTDNCPLNSNADQADNDNDGIGNVCDTDYVPPGCG